MRKTDRLFDLIKLLTKNEKRFFKLYSNLYHTEKTKSYLLLFDVLDKMQVYNSDLVLAQMNLFINPKNFNAVRKYLKENIIQSLKLYHRTNSPQLKFTDTLYTIKVLIYRQQYYEAKKLLEGLKKDGLEQECFTSLIEINELFNYVDRLEAPYNTVKQQLIQQRMEENAVYLASYQEISQYKTLFNKSYSIIYNPHTLPTSSYPILQSLLDELLQKVSTNFQTIKAQYYYLYALGITYFYMDQKAAYQQTIKQLYQLYTQHAYLLNIVQQYNILTHMAACYTLQNQKDQFYQVIHQLSSFIKKSSIHKYTFHYQKYIQLFDFHNQYPPESFPTSLVKELSHFLNTAQKHLNPHEKAGLYFVWARQYLSTQQYVEVENILVALSQNCKVSPENLHFLPLKFLKIICYYERNILSLMKSEILSLKRQLYKQAVSSSFIKNLLDQFIQAPKNPTQALKDISQLFEKENQETIYKIKLHFVQKWATSNP